jgi:REP element-mobilizing transposase RayT
MYHVTARGAAQRRIFADDDDRITFARLLRDVVGKHGWTCIAYCLMSTHYHLLLVTPHGDLAAGMRRLNGAYARSFNRRYGGSGAVFEARYHAELIEGDGHLLEAYRYVALNPVRAGLCARAEQWPWGSYAVDLGVRHERLINDPAVLEIFAPDPETARRRLRAFVDEALARPVSDTSGV